MTTMVAAPAASRLKTVRPDRRRVHKRTLLAFLAPGLLVYTVFLVWPMADSLWYSLTSWSGAGPQHFVGFSNYKTVFTNPTALTALRNTAVWAAVMVIVPAAIGLVLANALRGSGRWKGGVQALIYLPTVLPMIGVAVIWGWIYDPSFGFLNAFLGKVGLASLELTWLGRTSTALPALMVAGVWVSLGFPMILYLAGIQSIPPELYEAARVDGGGRWGQFRHVTFPGLRQTHAIVLALELIAALQVFAIVFAITAGGPGNSTQVLGTWMYANIFSFHRVGYGSAVGWVLAAMGLAVAIPYVLWMTRDDRI
jgi:raffinose/stachyose/melibiose transport system permease protein